MCADYTPSTHEKVDQFLLIKSWGCGFWSDMNHVFGCLLLAEITGRIPVTHWGRNSLYTDGSVSDAFQLYFEPVSRFGINDLQRLTNATLFPPKWSAKSLRQEDHQKWEGEGSRLSGHSYLYRAETILVSDFYIHLPDLLPSIPKTHEWHDMSRNEIYRLVADKYLRPRRHIVAEIDDFYRNRMGDSARIIAVHVRGTDKVVEPDYSLSLQTYFDIIDRDAPGWRIFLLTDEVQFVEAFSERYGSRVIFTNAQRSTNKNAVHHDFTADRIRLGDEVIKDTYLALRCQKFLGHGLSNPACIVSALKDWAEGDCILLGPSLLERHFWGIRAKMHQGVYRQRLESQNPA